MAATNLLASLFAPKPAVSPRQPLRLPFQAAGATPGPAQPSSLVQGLTGGSQVQVPQLSATMPAPAKLADETGFYGALGAKIRAQAAAAVPHSAAPGVAGSPMAAAAATGPLQGPNAGIAKTALTQLGIPYQWGGKAALGSRTDCSGLLQASAAAVGINIGRTTYEQWQQGTPVPPSQIKAGDAVFFHMGPKGPEHVGIALGNGSFVEDPHTGSSVKVEKFSTYPGFVGARRY